MNRFATDDQLAYAESRPERREDRPVSNQEISRVHTVDEALSLLANSVNASVGVNEGPVEMTRPQLSEAIATAKKVGEIRPEAMQVHEGPVEMTKPQLSEAIATAEKAQPKPETAQVSEGPVNVNEHDVSGRGLNVEEARRFVQMSYPSDVQRGGGYSS